MEAIIKGYMWVYSNLIWINIIFAILLVFFERRNPTTTWLWLMVLVFLPGIGFIFYLFLGQDLSKQRLFKTKEEEDNCFEIIAEGQKKVLERDEFLYKDPNFIYYEDLIKMHLMSSKSYFTQDNSVELFFSGEEKFDELLKSIKEAKSFIHMEYYIFKKDDLGKKILDALTEKANEGLEVKLLVDGMGGRTLTKGFLKPLREAGGEVGIFMPPLVPLFNIRINYRNHRKITIIDGKEAYLGGFNVGNEYIGLKKKFGYWRDTHIKIMGSAISSLQWRFFLDWRFATNKGVGSCQSYLVEDNVDNTVGIQIVSSGPDSKWPSIKDGYLKMVTNAREKVYIQTPYFIPDDSMFEALRTAGLSGVDVKVMIPNKPDHLFVYWASLSYIGELLQAGVKFYTYEKGFLHSKVFIMDEFVSSVGTANLDIRSFKLNFEVNAFIYDDMINLKLTEQFNKDLLDCKEITLEEYSKRPRVVKIKESISRLLSPIL
ncbi:cardiolipin synthase [Tissierella sp. Yu-01]|uniref:cardiolipin synthase n=1 Tax=Tissierella sp. Yu-01 TaxID=3035694 RepID=UPI00240DE0B5|nr:cardiolipin synthase [Tissierella sp. Yu-01]WFA10279.1 cardiolipin synthase [Tissierella sp. Yu-01]